MRQVTIASSKESYRKRLILSAAVATVGAVSLHASAATLDWDADPATPGIQAGNGTWYADNPAANTWRDGSTQTAWTQPGNIARFDSAIRSHVTLSGDIDTSAIHNMNGGVLTINSGSSLAVNGAFHIGSGSGTAAAFYQKGGAVNVANGQNFRLGATSGYGFYQLSSGTLDFAGGTAFIGRTPAGSTAATGVFYQSGNSAITSAAGLDMSSSASGSRSVYYMTGGTHTSSSGFTLASRGVNTTAQLTISNATLASTSTTGGVGRLTLGHAQNEGDGENQVAVVNLNEGGVLQVARIVSEGATPHASAVRHLNFNGGTVRFISTANDSIQGELLAAGQFITAANVYSGGANFEVVNNVFATVRQPLVAPVGDGVAGTVIPVVDGGSGYIGAPAVLITGATGATAVANMADDGTGNGTFKVESITITSPGINAQAVPAFSFEGGGAVQAAVGTTLGTAPNISGGLTKTGPGTLRLIGAANTYTGETRIEAGTIAVSGGGSFNPVSSLNVMSGATFDAANENGIVFSALKGAGTIRARDGAGDQQLLITGLLAPGDDGVGTLAFSHGDLRIGDGVVYEYEIGGTTESPQSDLIELTQDFNSGGLTFDGEWTLKVLDLGSVNPTEDMVFELFKYTSGAHPTWDQITLDLSSTNWSGGTVSVDSANKRVILTGVVPEPSAIALLGLAALPMLRRRRS